MSIKVMSYIWDHPTVDGPKGSELLLLLAIADHAADDGYCWPTIGVLAAKIRMTERSVMRFVQALEKRGELYVMRSNRNNRYVVRMGRTDAQVEAVLEHRKESIGDNLSRDKMTRDTDVTSIGDKGVTSIGDTGVTLIISEPSINHHEQEAFIEPAPHPKKPASNGIGPWFQAIVAACSIDLNAATGRQKGMLKNAAEVLRDDVKATPEQIVGFREWWSDTWRGKTGQAPRIADLRESWGEYANSGAGGGRRVVKIGR